MCWARCAVWLYVVRQPHIVNHRMEIPILIIFSFLESKQLEYTKFTWIQNANDGNYNLHAIY